MEGARRSRRSNSKIIEWWSPPANIHRLLLLLSFWTVFCILLIHTYTNRYTGSSHRLCECVCVNARIFLGPETNDDVTAVYVYRSWWYQKNKRCSLNSIARVFVCVCIIYTERSHLRSAHWSRSRRRVISCWLFPQRK